MANKKEFGLDDLKSMTRAELFEQKDGFKLTEEAEKFLRPGYMGLDVGEPADAFDLASTMFNDFKAVAPESKQPKEPEVQKRDTESVDRINEYYEAVKPGRTEEDLRVINESQLAFNKAVQENDYYGMGTEYDFLRNASVKLGAATDKLDGAEKAFESIKNDITIANTSQREGSAGPEVPEVAASPAPEKSKALGLFDKAVAYAKDVLGLDPKGEEPAQDDVSKNVPENIAPSPKATSAKKEFESKPSLAVLDGDKVDDKTQGPAAVEKGAGDEVSAAAGAKEFRAVGQGDAAEKGDGNAASVAAGAEAFRAVEQGDVAEKSPSIVAPAEDKEVVAASPEGKQEGKAADQPELSKYEALAAAVQTNGSTLTDGIGHNDDKAFNQIAKAAGVDGIDDKEVIKTSDAKLIQEQGAKLADMLKNNASPEALEKAGSDLNSAIEDAQSKAVDIGQSGVDPNQVEADNAKEQPAMAK